MLHILFVILKIIGIILAAILGILVLLVCIVLFVPVKYEVRSECDGTLDGLTAHLRVTWLLRLMRVTAVWKEKQFGWKVSILWWQRPKGLDSTIKSLKKKEVNEYEAESVKAVEEEKQKSQENSEDVKGIEKEVEKNPQEELEETVESAKEPQEEYGKVHTRISEKTENSKTSKSKFEKISEKCRQVYEKIKYTITHFCVRIKMLMQKKEKISVFIHDSTHKVALVKLKDEVFRLFKHLKPKKCNVYVHYGFEDPCTTGQVLAGISMLYPFIGAHVQIAPDFEKQILEGNLYIRGKLRGIQIVVFAIRLLLSKAVRNTYRDIRSFEI